jgi:hypothetical protein
MMASVMRTVEKVSAVRDYCALVLITSVQRFFLLLVLLALLIELTAALGALLGSATRLIFLRATAE